MEGIEILNTFVEDGGFVDGILSIIVGIISIAGIIIAIYFSMSYCYEDVAGATFLFSIIFLFLSVGGIYQSFFKEDITYYQVIIDNSVSMVEFNEKYEIIEIEGRIYTIKEREN